MRIRSFSVAATALAACVAPADPADPADPPDVEGSYGHVRVITPDGPRVLSYQVVGGHAIHELDMDLGPIADLRRRGGAARLGDRWPGGYIRYAFDESLVGQVCGTGMVDCVNARQRIRDTLEAMSRKLPLRFHEVSEDTLGGSSCFTNPTPTCDGIVFRYVEGQDTAGKSSHTGMEGGVQYISFRAGHEDDGASQSLSYNLQPGGGTIRHETLHAAGLFHEQSRRDRDTFIRVNWDNIIDGEGNGNYEIQDDSADLGPYDYNSIMHYSTGSQCVTDANDECVGDTMTPLVAGAVIERAGGRGGFSIEDANTVFRMYAVAPGTNSANDAFARNLVRADFDHDGYTDLAVGVPGEDLGGKTGAGMVSLWKGTPFGLVAWMTFNQASYPEESLTAGAFFGSALAAYDADADGVLDLAIGAPGALGGAGAVFVFRGTRDESPYAYRKITQASTGVDDDAPGDHFGAALAGGPLTGLVRADSCGSDFPYHALAVGAPSDGVPLLAGGESKRGSVFIFQETRPSCSNTSIMTKPTKLERGFLSQGAAEGDHFGSALAIGDLDGNGRADLAVGAPSYNNSAGKVYLYQGRLPPENPLIWSAMAVSAGEVAAPATNRFGSAIAIGDILSAGHQLVVGAPGGSGSVVVFTANGSLSLVTSQVLTDSAPATGDEFGWTLAIGNVDRRSSSDDLVIGVPGKTSDAGEVVIFQGGSSSLSTRTTLLQSDTLFGDRDPGDRFGSALAIGSFNGAENRPSTAHVGNDRLDLVIGAPGEKPDQLFGEDSANAGAFDTYLGSSTVVKPWIQLHQEGYGRASDPP